MASEKPKQGGKSPMSSSFPQSNEELAPFHLQDGADNLAGIIDNMVQSATFFLAGDVHGMPQSHAQEMSFPVMKDDLAWNVNVNDFGQYHTLGDSVAAAANIHTTGLGNSQIERNNVTNGADVSSGLQMLKAGGEANDNEICRPWLIENQINHAGTMSLSGYIPSAGEFGMNISQMCTAGGEANGNNIPVPWVFGNQFIHAGVAQSNNPEMLDGNFLTLGYESNVETGSKYNVSSEDNSQGTKQIVLSMLNTYSSQNFARNSLNSSSKLADDSSSFCKYDSGFIRRALNESDCKRIGHVQNDDGFSSLGQNANGMSHQVCNANVFSSPVQNVVASYHQAENKDRSSSQTQNVGWLSKPSGDGRVGTQLPLVDKQHHNHTPTSWNSGLGEKKKATFANTNPHTSFQGLRTKSLMPPNSNQVFLPDTGWFGVTESSPPSSWVRSTIQPASDQLRSPHVGSVRNFSSNPSVVLPFNGVTRSIGLQGQSGHPVQANNASTAKAAKGDLFSKSIRIQPANEGQEIPAVNEPNQSSSVPSGPSLKRTASICPPSAPQPWCKKTRSIKPVSHPSASSLRRTGPPHVPLTSVDSLSSPIPQTVSSRPPLAPTSPHLPHLPRTSSPHHMKWQGRQGKHRTPQPSGRQCHICKRDLSFTPEGPIYQPEKPITAAVLPCGHHFHDSCLQRITPLNQAHDPPCIPCAIGD
ncbi:hypothetical protein MANES_04G100800v8 [Manihot esculenta]|uniref:Uncharacterized protein n=4 Tax=Manihot esculenta TaxID=3983 RepID=A0ACB7HUF6_MANES|nr:hypothetical protein MANES_04G100800v8 [Manihot esculenta]KAG8656140.1 hypothetical protein MANES_04G100800v8 [Manihot esculenta]KAG8656150.1 hypothetical protein MANES_04G100800v8 [Manihot esculenta]KAG8656152.1 hypothetical protein MANES_04G100800v8 [Manihot esculenta]